MIKKIFSLFLLTFTFSCTRTPYVTARTEYIDMKRLASVAVDTPDPKKDTAYWGERLIIHWNAHTETPPIALQIQLHLRNGTEKTIKHYICNHSGVEYLTLDAYEYDLTGGIVSYNVELLANGESIAHATHKLWVEKI